MRDRDRILYCQAFRKSCAKTQVYKSGMDELLKTRLTQTLEVAQIARPISNELELYNDLTEVISLVHDLGHTPFGHAGERELNDFF
jgi:dGTPase